MDDTRIIELYNGGLSAYGIEEKYGIPRHRAYQILRRHKVRRRTTAEAASWLPSGEIIDRYLANESARSIARWLNSTTTSITDLLKRHEVIVRDGCPNRGNWEFIDDRNDFFFYFLGWLLSDGYIIYKNQGGRDRGIIIGLTVQRGDRHIIDFFRRMVCPHVKMVEWENAVGFVASIPRQYANILTEFGLVERKSLILEATDVLRTASSRQFQQMLVGYIEGDGHITIDKTIEITCGSKVFLDYIVTKLGVTEDRITPHNGSWRLRLTTQQSEALYGQMKSMPFRLLDRKWYRFQNFPFFFDDEWRDKPQICKQIIDHKDSRLKARIRLRPQQTSIRLVDYEVVAPLYAQYHYMGPASSKYHIGIFWDDRIIGAMSVRRPSRQRSGDWEIARMARDHEVYVHGLWSYVMAWVRRQRLTPGRVVTFSDNRLSHGKVYKLMGFAFAGSIRPDYYWCRDGRRYHKSRLRKTDAEKLTDWTEKQLRESQGYRQVWDYGKTKWEIII